MTLKQSRFKTKQLDVIRRLLDGLDDGLPRSCQESGLGAELPEADELLASASSFRHAMESLQTLKAAHRALAVLSENLEARISQSQESLLPASLHHGILNLPVEILSEIFKMSALRQKKEEEESYDLAFRFRFDPRDVRTLLQTCRRFHEVAVSCPELWAYVRTSMSGTNVDRMRSRSKGMGLHVELDVRISSGESSTDKLLDCVDDWRTLKMKNVGDDRRFFATHKSISCPNVENLWIYLDWPDRDGKENDAGLLSHGGWSFPNLKHILVVNNIEGFAIMPSISHITQLTYVAGVTADLRALVATLALTPFLQRLNISLKEAGGYGWDEDFVARVQLPCLTYLHIIGIENVADAEPELGNLMGSLCMPNLKYIHLSSYLEGESELLYNVLSRCAHLGSVKHLSLELLPYLWPEVATYENINEALKRFPSLLTLDLAVFGLDLYTFLEDVEWKENPQLRSVNITQVSTYRLPFESKMVGEAIRLGTEKTWYGAHFFELSADSTADKLKRLFPENIKLVVKDETRACASRRHLWCDSLSLHV